MKLYNIGEHPNQDGSRDACRRHTGACVRARATQGRRAGTSTEGTAHGWRTGASTWARATLAPATLTPAVLALIALALAALVAGACLPGRAFAESNAQTVEIGTGTQSTYLTGPYGDTSYECSLTEILYTASEIGSVGSDQVITQIAFNVTKAASFTPSAGIMVYLANTTATTVDSDLLSVIDPCSFTLVYEGTPTLGSTTGWESLTFSTPFAYTEGSNLAIIILRKGENATDGTEATTPK